MLQSLKLSHLVLRLSLALAFLWFGIDKFTHPAYWVNAWLGQGLQTLFGSIGFTPPNLMYLVGIVQVLIAVSLMSTLLLRLFSVVAISLLVAMLIINGFNEIFVRDVVLIGGFLTLLFWPERHLA